MNIRLVTAELIHADRQRWSI